MYKNIRVAFFVLAWVLLIGFYFYRLGVFSRYIFDEKYYVDAATQLYRFHVDPNFQHPPLGKFIISIPFYFLPISSFSWRLASVVFGIFGLGAFYFFCRKVGLSQKKSLLLVYLLTFTNGWYIVSRLGLLEIFLCTVVLIAVYSFYLYLHRYHFDQNFNVYSSHGFFFLASFLIGVACAIKWNAFFIALFIFFIFLFYFRGSVYKRGLFFLAFLLIAGYSYVALLLPFYSFNVFRIMVATFDQVVIHNSQMLPGHAFTVNSSSLSSNGGWKAVLTFLLFSPEYDIGTKEVGKYIFSINPVISYTFIVLTFGFIVSFMSGLYKVAHTKKLVYPSFLKDRDILFTYSVSFFLIIPWMFIPRIQYVYYYIVAYPFVLLCATILLVRYCSRRWLYLYTGIYVLGFLYSIRFYFGF